MSDYWVEGLADPVEILIDSWGVPHVYAASDGDLYFAQGFNAARERLFQIDLWRRRGLGRLSEVFGERCIEQDRAARLFLYRNDLEAEWTSYGSGAAEAIFRFVAGINSFVELCETDASLLPEEFEIIGYRPSRWAAEDVVRIRSHGLYHNLEQEVARAQTLAKFGAAVEDLRRAREPEVKIVIPDGLDVNSIPDDVLAVYRLATSPPVLDDGTPMSTDGQGSNNWVIAGERTSTGRPLLANDPHRGLTLPSLRYIAHLNSPTTNVIGGGEPSLPGISIGHNESIAFGLTVFAIDQEDLYVYETADNDPLLYRYGSGWERMTEVNETVAVAGREAITITLTFTRHGPVIYTDPSKNLAFAVRAAWLESGMVPYLGSLSYQTANNADEFIASMDHWGAPGENHVFADTRGDIGWVPAGRVPIRPNWDGLLPVPGDGRYEWQGHYEPSELPRERNPAQGWFASANQMNLPARYPNHRKTVGYDWYPPTRQDRITEVLRTNMQMSVDDALRLQNDVVSLPARSMTAFLRTMPASMRSASRSLLETWDCVESVDSAAAALFEVWYRRHFRPACLEAAVTLRVPAEKLSAALAATLPDETAGGDPRIDLAIVGDPETYLGSGGTEKLWQIATVTLAAATTELSGRLGVDPTMWRWGDLHHSSLTHIAAGAFGPNLPSWARTERYPRPGSGDTVAATTYVEDYLENVGATFRMVIDVGSWDNSRAMNSPGQSGRPGARHYDDLYPLWASDRSFPLLYSREAIEAHTESRINLKPRATT